MTVTIIENVFLNDSELDNCGILIIKSSDSDKVGGKITSIIIPGRGYGSENRFSLQFNCNGEGERAGKCVEMERFVTNKDRGIFGFVFTENGKSNLVTAFVSRMRSMCCGDQEADSLLDISIFDGVNLKKRPIVTTQIEDMKAFFESQSDVQISDYFKTQYVAMGIIKLPPKSGQAVFICYRDYFQPYVNFISKHPSMTNKECEEFVRNLDNFPKFTHETLKFDNHDSNYQVVADFLRFHSCGNTDCGGFSFQKCSGCNAVHYCDPTCQRKDFVRHQAKCETWVKRRKVRFCVPSHLRDIMGLSESNSPDLLTMEVFMREVMMKAFACFYDELSRGLESFHANCVYLCMKRGNYGMSPRKAPPSPNFDISKFGKMLKRKGMKPSSFKKTFKQMEEIHILQKKTDMSLKDDLHDWYWYLTHGPLVELFGNLGQQV